MTISEQIEAANSQLQSVIKTIDTFPLSLSVLDLENDPNFIHSKQISDDVEPPSFTQLNASAQAYKHNIELLNKLWIIKGLICEIKSSLKVSHLDNLTEEDNVLDDHQLCGSAELELAFLSLHKLQLKIDEFKSLYPGAIIVESLNSMHEQLFLLGVNQIKTLFGKFFPNETQFINPIIVDDTEFEYLGEFVGVFRDIQYKGKQVLQTLIANKRKSWESVVLDTFLLQHKNSLQFIQEENHLESGSNHDLIIYSIKIIPNSFNFDKTYFNSIASFIRFINLFQDKSIQNMYLSKISKNLTEMISINIDKFLGNESLIHELMQLIDLSKRSNWSLSVNSTLGTNQENVLDSLNTIYIDWLTDKYLKLISNYFKDSDLIQDKFLNIQSVEIDSPVNEATEAIEATPITDESQDQWDDKWDDDEWNDDNDENQKAKDAIEVPDEEDDEFLNEEWGWGDEGDVETSPKKEKGSSIAKNSKSAPKKPSIGSQISNVPVPVVAPSLNSFQVTGVPLDLLQLISEYMKDGSEKDEQKIANGLPLILTAITSLSSILYPNLERSFLLYNDLFRLQQLLDANLLKNKIHNNILIEYAEMSMTKLKFDIIPNINSITLKINLEHDDGISRAKGINFNGEDGGNDLNGDEYELDDTVLDQLSLLKEWFFKFSGSVLQQENPLVFKRLLIFYIDHVNNWITDCMISQKEITEYQSLKVTKVIENVQNIILPIAIEKFGASAKDEIKSIHRLENTKYLITNHLKEIMERFYSGEFYDYETNELISVIKSVFMESAVRTNMIEEIELTRNMIDDE